MKSIEEAIKRRNELYPMANVDDYPDNPNVNRLNSACGGAFMSGYHFAINQVSAEDESLMRIIEEGNKVKHAPEHDLDNVPALVRGYERLKKQNETLLEALRHSQQELKEWADHWKNEAESFDHPAQEQERRLCQNRYRDVINRIKDNEVAIKKATE